MTACGEFRQSPHPLSGAILDVAVILLNLLYAVLGVVVMYASYRIIDRLTPEVDFAAELQRGNIAVAIFIGALFLAIAVIIGGALN
jgi:putative membrane protein